MKIFFDRPEEKFHIREIARMTKLSAPGVMKILDKLEKEGLLVTKKENVVVNVQLARTEKVKWLRRCNNIQSLHESGLISYLRDEYEEPEAVVLFGSYSRGEDTSASDVDIAVITGKRIKLDLKKYEKKIKRKISIFELDIKTAEIEFLNDLANGIVLSGYLTVIQ
jgi:predicted nucleotidyltransferase